MRYLVNLIKDQDGQGLVEYSLVISLVILVSIAAVRLFGIELKSYYLNNIINKLP